MRPKCTIKIRTIAGGTLGTLTATEDRWILNGCDLGPETCAALDAAAFRTSNVSMAAADVRYWVEGVLRRDLRPVRLPNRSLTAIGPYKRLIAWLRDNFDYPAGGEA